MSTDTQAGAVKVTSYSDIDPLAPEWLWPGHLPLSELTVIAGEGGIGKGFLLADIVSRVTRGLAMPDGSGGMAPGSVIMVTAEDDPHMAMSYRLRAAKANLSKVYDLPSESFLIPKSIPDLREAIKEIGDVRLIVIDPLAAVSSIPITSGNVKIRQQLMNPIWRLARDEGVSLVAVHHTTKSGRTAGSKAITDTARQVLRVSRAAGNDTIRLVQVEKSNIASDKTPDIAYTVAGDFPDVGVQWLELPDGASVKEPSTADKILALLDDPAHPVMATQDIAREVGAKYGTIRVAINRLAGDGQVVSPERGFWSRPAAPAPLHAVKDGDSKDDSKDGKEAS